MTSPRPDAVRAFTIARAWFLEGRRVDMGDLAAELGISRATLHRWVGGRDQLLGEILWSMTVEMFEARASGKLGRGAKGIAELIGTFVRTVNDSKPFREFLRNEPERALRILTTKASVVQSRAIAKMRGFLEEEVAAGRLTPPLPVEDLAYLLVRISESFIYTDVITGAEPDATKAYAAAAALLS
ncbi:QsdR family transcriptional regulator [Amycolatopsis regifaucium]|uniref:TetR family transcriptional regulator n=1 Tax=Amycolatopsis regifaucium TaxID=546365 RepID=A0A154MT26_9PSEU|nr:TetR family transcriptional regulator [Amycolatopsis regifaucium]OKA08327.1 TetR family transcriptional regulator [Amycolatopsis regifaucium]